MTTTSRGRLTFALCGILAWTVTLASASFADSTYFYTVHPIQRSDRVDLEVRLRYAAIEDTVVVDLLQDNYGVPDLVKYITTFEGTEGCRSGPKEKKPMQRWVVPNAEGEVHLRYIISYDPQALDDYAFGPNVGPAHFHVAGCQWMLPIGNTAATWTYDVRIADAPPLWTLYSSMGPDAAHTVVKDNYDDLITTALGGGAGQHVFSVRGKPVSVHVAGTYTAVPDTAIFEAVERIVTLQREWFDDYEWPFYHVTVLPRSGVIAGTCIPNLFVCFIRSDIQPGQLNGLLAHEMFHNWLPNKFHVDLPAGENHLKYEWFYEGFTDLLARMILRDASLLAPADFAQLIDQDIINLANNPHHAATYAQQLEAVDKNAFGQVWKKLSYYRGALIGLAWDAQLRSRGSRLKDLVRELLDTAQQGNGTITEERFFTMVAAHGPDAQGDLERYIIQGQPIPLRPDALGTDFALKTEQMPRFDPGFSMEAAQRTRKITGVIPDGPAYNAGLREGMDFVSSANSNRFINGWSADRPMLVTVRSEVGEQTFSYFPHGDPMSIVLYRSGN